MCRCTRGDGFKFLTQVKTVFSVLKEPTLYSCDNIKKKDCLRWLASFNLQDIYKQYANI